MFNYWGLRAESQIRTNLRIFSQILLLFTLWSLLSLHILINTILNRKQQYPIKLLPPSMAGNNGFRPSKKCLQASSSFVLASFLAFASQIYFFSPILSPDPLHWPLVSDPHNLPSNKKLQVGLFRFIICFLLEALFIICMILSSVVFY